MSLETLETETIDAHPDVPMVDIGSSQHHTRDEARTPSFPQTFPYVFHTALCFISG